MSKSRGGSLVLLGLGCLAVGLGVARRPSAAIAKPGEAAPVAGFGTIKGRLVWPIGSKLPPIRLMKKEDKSIKDSTVCAEEGRPVRIDLLIDPKTRGVKNGFASLVSPKGSNPAFEKQFLAKNPEVVVKQKNCRFVPYAFAVWEPQNLIYQSPDPVNHNIHAQGFDNTFNWVAGHGSVNVFQLSVEKSPMRVCCEVHSPRENSLVGVYDHPFFAVTDSDGSFEIKGVPAGFQQLSVWHELQGYATNGRSRGQEVSVPSGGTVDVGDIPLDSDKVWRALRNEIVSPVRER